MKLCKNQLLQKKITTVCVKLSSTEEIIVKLLRRTQNPAKDGSIC